MIIAGTGHRPNKLGLEYKYNGPYSEHIRHRLGSILLSKSPEAIISGMALGFDTLLAMIAIELKIPLFAYIPFKGQERMWPTFSKKVYYDLLKRASIIRICDVNQAVTYKQYQDSLDTAYSKSKMDRRNENMIDDANEIVSYYDGTPGGTANCIKYIQEQGKSIIYVPLFNP